MPLANFSTAQKATVPPGYRRRLAKKKRKPRSGPKLVVARSHKEPTAETTDELNGDDDAHAVFGSLPLLPLALVCQYLSLDDQRYFRLTCRLAAFATDQYWASRQKIALGADLRRLFPDRLPSYKLTALHSVRQQVVSLLKLVPSGALASVDWRPLRAIDVESLQMIIDSSGRPARKLFANVVSLNLRGCIFGMDELAWLADACPAVNSITVSERSVRRGTFGVSDMGADRKLVVDTVRQLSWLRKSGHLPDDRIRLLAILLNCFPQLEKVIVEND